MSEDAVFVRAGAAYRATELARGPWDPAALHGGVPAALVVHALEREHPPEGLRLARLTLELLRPVPLAELSVNTRVVRPGRRVMLLEAEVVDPEGVVVTRALALRVQPSEVSAGTNSPPPFPGPEAGAAREFGLENTPPMPMFATHAMEIRFVEGAFRELGAATAWFRLRYPLVAGEPLQPLELAAGASDFGNGISSVLSWEEHVFINPDLTLYLERAPRGEWVALQAQTRVLSGQVATAESVLWDQEGRIGHATQALLVSRR
jgi:acyl-coenzyme A thioesterase PaaI-like protein